MALCGDDESLSGIDSSHVSRDVDISCPGWGKIMRQRMLLNLACGEDGEDI